MLLMVVLALGVGLSVSIINSTNDDIYDEIDLASLSLEERIILLEAELDWLNDELEYQEEYIEYLEEAMLDSIYLTNLFIDYGDELRYIDESLSDLDERYETNQDELFEKYVDFILAEFPDWYSERSELVVEPEVLIVTLENATATVTYEEVRFTLFIESVEVCVDDTCNLIEYEQTDYVLTVEELETGMLELLDTVLNPPIQ